MTHRLMVASATDKGLRRSRNEDAVVGVSWPGDHGEALMLAVADGMGGTAGGEVASALAIGAAERILRAGYSSGRISGQDAWLDALTSAFAGAVSALREQSEQAPDLMQMGTTLTCLVVDGGRIIAAHVGDSRAYLFRAHELRQLTTDHNAAAELVSDGRLTSSEALSHKSRSILTRWLAPDCEVPEVPELGALAAEPGDVVLVCSDGLHGMVPDEEIAALLDEALLANQAGLTAAASALVVRANERGGRDNISVVLGAWPRS
jgi:PPM family protein phosphatase